MSYSPIILFTYKRLDTLKRCVESLQKCPESVFSDLIIVSDHWANEVDVAKVTAVREFLLTIKGFQQIKIIERDQNHGVEHNIIKGIKLMASSYKQFIVVEDDLVVQDGFLRFLNASLDFYANYPEVLSVSGFTFVDKIPEDYHYDAYFAKRICPWGWGTWAHKIIEVDWNVQDKDVFLQSSLLQRKFNAWGSDRSRMLVGALENKIRAWDIRLDYYQFKNNLCTLYPVVSFVENIGFGCIDASNTLGYNRYKTRLKNSNKGTFQLPKLVLFNKAISNIFISKNSISQRILTRLLNYFYIIRKK